MGVGKKVLIVGGGGREDTFAWKLGESVGIGEIYAAPGNPGMHYRGVRCLPYKADHIGNITTFCEENSVDLVVVGPEAPLAIGLADELMLRQIPVVGPGMAAARIETSKMHAKRIMAKGNVPTAPYRDFYDASMAHSQVEALWKEYGGLVVKADGLCAGKGVYVCKTTDEVHAAIDKLMVKKVHGDAGKAILLEKKIDGPEVSAISLCDASDVKHMPESQDYKPVGENDAGPNTGGMGSFSPVPIVTQEIRALIHHNVMHPTLNAMRSCGTPFGGFLYGGLKLTPDGPMVLEFNARSGDPETQVLLRRMKSDFLEYLIACANNELDRLPPMVTDDRAAVCVVLASEGYGYHDNFPRGKPITGLDDVRRDFGKSVQVFHAGTKFDDNGDLVTNGGRVLGVTALGDTLDEASDIAYQAARLIRFEGKYCRPDIGKKVMERGR